MCQGNLVKRADERTEEQKEELRCIIISSPTRKMLKLVPVS